MGAPALIDVVAGDTPSDVTIRYPLAHVLLAPFTVAADWLNGGSRADVISFLVWAVLAVLAWSVVGAARETGRRLKRAALRVAGGLALVVVFVTWVAFAPRPIPRLVVRDSSALVFDIHTHTALSHDGRAGFDIAANANWHGQAGFHAAFVTDHNRYGAARPWQATRAPGAVRMLDGEELSLAALHLIVLGVRRELGNAPWNSSAESTLALVRTLAAAPERPLLVASLPEYRRYWWGEQLGTLIRAGVGALEIRTSSPKGMEFTPAERTLAITSARLHDIALLGATDMHGLGYTASVWNVARIPEWQALTDTTLQRTLLAHLRAGGVESNQVVALDRWESPSRAWAWAAAPLGLWGALRRTTATHALVMVLWTLLPVALAASRRSA